MATIGTFKERRAKMALDRIDISDLAAEEVKVRTWFHSGPVSVSLTGVRPDWLLSKIDKAILREYHDLYKRNAQMP